MRVQGATNRNTPARRRELLAIALEVFTEKGFAGATMDEIVVRSRASKGSIYHHFRSKDALGAALYADALEQLQLYLVRALYTAKEPRGAVESFVEAQLDWYSGNLDLGSYMQHFEAGAPGAARTGEVLERITKFRADVVAWAETHIKAGDLRKMSEPVLLSLLLGPAREFLRDWRPDLQPEAFVEARKTLPPAVWQSVRAEDDLDRARDGTTQVIRLNRIRNTRPREK